MRVASYGWAKKVFFDTQVTTGEDDVKTVDITAKQQQQALRTLTSILKNF